MATRRNHFEKRLVQLKNERSGWDPHYRELGQYIKPRSTRFLLGDRQAQGNKRNSSIFDNTATVALRTLQSGMMSGITSPARPWALLKTPDSKLNEMQSVKWWLETARTRLFEVFLKSNLYTTLPDTYDSLGCYGTSSFAILEDTRTTMRCQSMPVGSYYLGVDHTGRVDTCYRELEMTVGQLVAKFGKDKCSPTVRSAYETGATETWVQVVHAIEPNADWDEQKIDAQYKAFISVYYEVGSKSDENPFLSIKGFDEFPVVAPRWEITGEDIYGSSPAMMALGDIKALQLEQKRKAQALDKMVSPPMKAPTSLRNKRASVLSGDITYVDEGANNQKFEPVYNVNVSFAELLEDIRENQDRIKKTFFTDLFMMIANDERSNITAYEIAARKEEKLMMLGPVYLRLNDELLDPTVERAFNICMRAGLIPPPPPEMQGMPLVIEYISVMAQAMKAIGVESIERVMTFAGNLGQAFPEILDRVNADRAFVHYADMAGSPADVVYDDAAVAQARAARAKKQQAEQAMMMAAQGAETAKTLSQASLSDNNALAQLASRMQGSQPVPGAQ